MCKGFPRSVIALALVLGSVLTLSAQDSGKQATYPVRPVAPSSLPNAPIVPLTPRQKLGIFVKSTYSPYTFASAAFDASWAQATGGWYDYGGGMSGWGKRFGTSLADTEGKVFFSSFVFPVAFRQDPRYFPSGKKGFGPRALYAASRVFVGRSDDGKRMPNYSEIFGALITCSIQNSYYPDRNRDIGDTFIRFGGDFSSTATSNLLKEFSPEIRRLARKIVPKPVQKVEDKLPRSVRQLGVSSD